MKIEDLEVGKWYAGYPELKDMLYGAKYIEVKYKGCNEQRNEYFFEDKPPISWVLSKQEVCRYVGDLEEAKANEEEYRRLDKELHNISEEEGIREKEANKTQEDLIKEWLEITEEYLGLISDAGDKEQEVINQAYKKGKRIGSVLEMLKKSTNKSKNERRL